MRREHKRYRTFTRRAALLGAGQIGLFGLLVGRMYHLQVIESDRYRTLAEDNRVSPRLIAPERGLIVDRNGLELAINRKTYRITVVPEQAKDLDRVLGQLSQLVALPEAERQRVLKTARRGRAFLPVTVLDNLDWDAIARIAVHTPDLPGVHIEMIPRRLYPVGPLAAHVVGYVGAVAEEDLTGDPVLTIPEFRIGKSGIERTHDLALRGRAGVTQVEVNAVGRVVRELKRIEGVPGKEVMLTIDLGLQEEAMRRFGTETGAAVIMDVHTGELLALASNPSYDPNAFARGITIDEWKALLGDPDHPLTNKAVAGQYAPGSTFKMVVAAAALEAGIAKPSQTVFCSGSLSLGDGKFHCWRRNGHGTMNMHEAIVQSCDVYFYELARRVGIDRIAEMGKRLGVGVTLGIELPQERPGLMPTRAWKRAVLGKSWMVGETLIAGIGQGYVLATPLQLAVYVSRLVNGGRAVVPRLTRAIDERPALAADSPPTVGLSPETLTMLGSAMAGVTMGSRGTARGARIPDEAMAMGGKTGTSQVRRITAAERRTGVRKNEERERAERDHALFVGYAPIHAPRYAVSVIVEHGGGGAAVAAPIARDLLIETQRRDPSGHAPAAAQASAAPGGAAAARIGVTPAAWTERRR